jgi:hypothetical protein
LTGLASGQLSASRLSTPKASWMRTLWILPARCRPWQRRGPTHSQGGDEKGAVPLHLRREGDEAGQRIGGPDQLLGPRIQSMRKCGLLQPSLPLGESVPTMMCRGSSQVRPRAIETDHPTGGKVSPDGKKVRTRRNLRMDDHLRLEEHLVKGVVVPHGFVSWKPASVGTRPPGRRPPFRRPAHFRVGTREASLRRC